MSARLTSARMLDLVRTLWTAGISTLRDKASAYGASNPVGVGDAKTGSPSTYRPVGPTCPDGSSAHLPKCAYLGSGCYAQGGNVALHSVRSGDTIGPSVIAAAIGIVWALRTDRVCRLHVSGDFVSHKRIDHRYIAQLGMLCDVVRQVSREQGLDAPEIMAWSYTHIPADTFAPYQRYLARKGIHVRYSDHLGDNGVIVSDFAALPAMKAHGIRYLKCPAQLPQGKTCDECRACWELPSYIVAFEPHGSGKRKARFASLRILQ